MPGSEGLFSPHWSSDGRYIAALAADLENLMLYDFKVQKWAELTKITAAFPIYFHPFGSDVARGLAPDDSPLVLCDVGTQEIYALDLQLP